VFARHNQELKMKIRGPFVTIAAVATLGAGILLVNISQEPDKPPPGYPAAQSTTTAPAPAPTTAPPPAFPAKADYVGKIPTPGGTITVEIAVDGEKAIAYACDGNTIESWLRGNAVNGAVTLASKDKSGRLEGRLQGDAVAGTLWIGEKRWDFSAPAAQPPAGLYVYDQAGTRSSWIIDQNGGVTGVQRQPDGTTTPAPGLSLDRTSVINGRPVVVNRVEGDSDV
jgi:hypothetical protein